MTNVTFRKWNKANNVIAIFTNYQDNFDFPINPDTVMCYEHVGQHGEGSYSGLLQTTKPAKPSEYTELLNELISIGYDDLKIVQKRIN